MKAFRFLLSIMLFVSFLMISCNKDDDAGEDEEINFTVIINNGGAPEEVQEKKDVVDSTVTEENQTDGTIWKCVSKKYSVTEGNSDFPLFNPNASVIYPGSLLQGKTLSSASPSIIPVKRAGGTISIDVIDGSAQPSFSVTEVTKSAIAEAANKIIGESSGIVPANFSFEAKQVQSKEQLALALGLNVQSQFVEVGAKLSFRQDKEYNRFIVKLNQSFYTLSFDVPTSYDQLFAPEVKPSDLEPYVQPGNPATYISDVTYGRIYYMLIESSSKSTEIESAINASFSGAVTSVDLEVDGSYLSSLSELRVNVIALGGESKSTFATIGETNIANLVQLLGESTDIRSGVPISYVVRSALNKEVVAVKLATEYEVKTCQPLATPLGSPILFFDANDLRITPDYPQACRDCISNINYLAYSSTGDSYIIPVYNTGGNRYEYSKNGTAVQKWMDLSKSETHAYPVAGDEGSYPMYVASAFDNGKAAVDFYRGPIMNGGQRYVNQRLTFSGTNFNNTDYTIFFVAAFPNQSNVYIQGDGLNVKISNTENKFGPFLTGYNNSQQFSQLDIGFKNSSTFTLSHLNYDFNVNHGAIKPDNNFKIYALKFSQKDGMSIYINGEKVASDPTKTKPLLNFTRGMICAGAGDGALTTGSSRVRIAEIRAYSVAATDNQVRIETNEFSKKYGI